MEIFKLFGSVFIDDKDALKGLDDIDGKADKTGNTLGSMIGTAAKWGAGIAAGAGAAVGGLFALASKVSESASEINDMSVRTGLSTDRLQELKFATGQVGVQFDSITSAVGKLTKTMSGADEGSAAAAAAFKKLGIETSDGSGHLRKMDDVFPEVIKKLAGMTDVTDRNALAMSFFGKGAMELVPLLDAGGAGIDAMSKQAHDLGLVLSNDAVNSADKFGDTLDQVKGAFGGVIAKVGVEFMPMFQSMMDWVIAHMPEIQNVIHTTFSVAGEVIGTTVDVIKSLTHFFTEHWSIIKPILAGIAAGALTFGVYTLAIHAAAIGTAAWSVVTATATTIGGAFAAVIAFITSPIGIVVLAIAAFIAIGVLLYENWDVVKTKASEIWTAIVDVIRGPVNLILGMINTVIGAYEGMINGLGSAINSIPDIKIPDWVPLLGGKSFGIPDIPHVTLPKIPMLAEGGDITESGRVLVGERGPEFLDLPEGARVTPLDKVAPGAEKNKAEVTNHLHFAPGSVVIPVKDLAEIKSVVEFFKKFPQIARQLGFQ